ncbi:hypothetical protein Ancab_030077 [Ancistrocladus abbreviatus]
MVKNYLYDEILPAPYGTHVQIWTNEATHLNGREIMCSEMHVPKTIEEVLSCSSQCTFHSTVQSSYNSDQYLLVRGRKDILELG